MSASIVDLSVHHEPSGVSGLPVDSSRIAQSPYHEGGTRIAA
ncbi:MAG TPA: hypothetical protein VFU80_05305 [Sphingomicrobium sp.]|nr:hypothetical protein [Sphingomicrobium sp.]